MGLNMAITREKEKEAVDNDRDAKKEMYIKPSF